MMKGYNFYYAFTIWSKPLHDDPDTVDDPTVDPVQGIYVGALPK